ncbi:CRISPR-associated helicase Cas3' [Limosilactobacillus kribbianus]|uniref:CRISPR-associated helicase Cas3' n=1 Tax=Limosilactobacillus kribbianus TaxID=2982695 RepID=UPI002263D9AE|nr:CRISPR-associated helicase Cas3' [Limosilactobacillus kribbianus]
MPKAENVGEEGSVVINSWFSGKKSILADFSIGTIDHLLLMSLKQKHLFLRHLGLSGKVVVIDEVHAYDTYMSSYLEQALVWLGVYSIPVIALSATLPKQKRAELMQAYYFGKYGEPIEADTGLEDSQAYPLLTYMDGKEVKQLSEFPKSGNSKINKIIRLNSDDEELINKAVRSISEGGVAGIIVNTVKRAQKLSQLVPDNIPKLVLHSAFLAPDREKLEERLQSAIGKNADRPERMIVIGTQVLEQSLDIDFDVLFTDVAPIDLLIQRIGRLHRHKIERPAKLTEPMTYILGINSLGDYGDANEAIYEKYWLMKTDYFFPDTIRVPEDVSRLVQLVYDPITDSEIVGIREAQHQERLIIEKERQKAQVYQIDFPSPTDTIHGWLDRDRRGVADEASAEAAVRDIKESIEVILIQHTQAGDFLLDGRPLSDVQDYEIAQQLIRLPNAVTPNIEKTIKDLETKTNNSFSEWQNNIWLKGILVLPLNEQKTVSLNNWQIHYSNTLGLMYEKEDQDGQKTF